MGWFKKLKKKLKFKSLVKGIKLATAFIPGGELINKGISIAEKQYKNIVKAHSGKADPAAIEPVVEKKKSILPLAIMGLAAAFLFKK